MLVREALAQNIPAHQLFSAYQKHFSNPSNNDIGLLLDTAAARSHKGLLTTKVTPSIPERVASGNISMDDLRNIGPSRFLKALETNWFLLSQLAEIHAGQVDYGAEQVKEAIEKHANAKGVVNEYNVRGVFAAARICGYEVASKLKHPAIASPFVTLVEGTVEEKIKGVNYADDVFDGLRSKHNILATMIYEAYAAGATVDQAISYLDGEIIMQQIQAINEHGVAASVSGGWL